MKIYVLVENKDGIPQFETSSNNPRKIRAYMYRAAAKNYAKKLGCSVVEVDVTKGELV